MAKEEVEATVVAEAQGLLESLGTDLNNRSRSNLCLSEGGNRTTNTKDI